MSSLDDLTPLDLAILRALGDDELPAKLIARRMGRRLIRGRADSYLKGRLAELMRGGVLIAGRLGRRNYRRGPYLLSRLGE